MPFAVAEYVNARCSRISAEDHFPSRCQANSSTFIPAVARSIALRTVSNSGCIHLFQYGLEYALHFTHPIHEVSQNYEALFAGVDVACGPRRLLFQPEVRKPAPRVFTHAETDRRGNRTHSLPEDVHSGPLLDARCPGICPGIATNERDQRNRWEVCGMERPLWFARPKRGQGLCMVRHRC